MSPPNDAYLVIMFYFRFYFGQAAPPSTAECPISTVSHQVENQTTSGAGGGNVSSLLENTHNNNSSCQSPNQVAVVTAHNNQNVSVISGDSGHATSNAGVGGCGGLTNSGSQMSTPVHPQLHNQQHHHVLHQQPGASSDGSGGTGAIAQVSRRKETLEAKRERKAAKTLAIITGAFVVCWLPFFLMALLLPLCEDCHISDWIASLFLWLGYFNSTLNPVIYTIFSPEFRQAFKRILFGSNSRTSYYRRGKL